MQKKVKVKIKELVKTSLDPDSVLLRFTNDSIVDFRIFAGTVIRANQSPSDPVIVLLPLNSGVKCLAEIIEVEENYIISLPDGVDSKRAVFLASRGVGVYLAIHKKGGLVPGESVLVVGGDFITVWVILQVLEYFKCGIVLLKDIQEEEKLGVVLEENKERFRRAPVFVRKEGDVKEKTGGLGVDLIVNLKLRNNLEDWRDCTDWIAANGRIVVKDENLEINPVISRVLYVKNASIGFFCEDSLGLFRLEWGKALTMVEHILKLMGSKAVQPIIKEEYCTLEELNSVEALNKANGTVFVLKN